MNIKEEIELIKSVLKELIYKTREIMSGDLENLEEYEEEKIPFDNMLEKLVSAGGNRYPSDRVACATMGVKGVESDLTQPTTDAKMNYDNTECPNCVYLMDDEPYLCLLGLEPNNMDCPTTHGEPTTEAPAESEDIHPSEWRCFECYQKDIKTPICMGLCGDHFIEYKEKEKKFIAEFIQDTFTLSNIGIRKKWEERLEELK